MSKSITYNYVLILLTYVEKYYLQVTTVKSIIYYVEYNLCFFPTKLSTLNIHKINTQKNKIKKQINSNTLNLAHGN